ncbi:MAG: DUF427 domain-containing protein [Actinomycetes bacterium]
MTRYPEPLVPPDGVAPVPRRLRGMLAGAYVFQTTRALYVWEFPPYPQYYVPLADVAADVLVDEGRSKRTRRGTAAYAGLRVGAETRPGAVQVYGEDAPEPLRQTARFEWSALDAWFEEDEQVFVHPRNPYARCDVLRSGRPVRVEVEGVVLAEAASSVVLFETGLPPRYYLDRTALHQEHLVPSDTVTSCPYKGTTSAYWSARIGEQTHPDLAWSYAFPTVAMAPIAGLVAFYNEKVDLYVDGERQERPVTPFS